MVYSYTMKVIWPTVLVVLSGCFELKFPVQGELYVSPKHGVTYYGTLEDGTGIDGAADAWLEWCSVRGVDPGASLQAVVYVIDGETVDGLHAGWWEKGEIRVARDAPYDTDPHFGLDSFGFFWLRHEWLHELLQDGGHSGFPNP